MTKQSLQDGAEAPEGREGGVSVPADRGAVGHRLRDSIAMKIAYNRTCRVQENCIAGKYGECACRSDANAVMRLLYDEVRAPSMGMVRAAINTGCVDRPSKALLVWYAMFDDMIPIPQESTPATSNAAPEVTTRLSASPTPHSDLGNKG